MKDRELNLIDLAIRDGQMPINDLEAVRQLLALASHQAEIRPVYTAYRIDIAAFLMQLHLALAQSAKAPAALYVYLLMRNYCRKAHLAIP